MSKRKTNKSGRADTEIPVFSTNEATGAMPTPAHSEEELRSYQELAGAPARPRAKKK